MNALVVLLESVQKYCWNWSAWLDLAEVALQFDVMPEVSNSTLQTTLLTVVVATYVHLFKVHRIAVCISICCVVAQYSISTSLKLLAVLVQCYAVCLPVHRARKQSRQISVCSSTVSSLVQL